MAVATAQFSGVLPKNACKVCGEPPYGKNPSGWECTNGHIWAYPDISAVECCKKKDEVIQGLAERTAAQSELLSKRAEACQACSTKDDTIMSLSDKLRICSEELGKKAEGTGSATRSATGSNRKTMPVASGVLDYFPDALLDVAFCSYVGNEQHNPGTALHWDRSKSTDEADALIRHFMDRGKFDSDGVRHSAKVAWRALSLLQKEIEADAQ